MEGLASLIDSLYAAQYPTPPTCCCCAKPYKGYAYRQAIDDDRGGTPAARSLELGLVCRVCFSERSTEEQSRMTMERGTSLFPLPLANSAAELRLSSALGKVLLECRQLRLKSTTSSHELCAQVLSLLNDFRMSGFAGAELLLRSVVDPLRATVVDHLPQASRASTSLILQTPDLALLPAHLTELLSRFCMDQVASFTTPATSLEEATSDARRAGCLLPLLKGTVLESSLRPLLSDADCLAESRVGLAQLSRRAKASLERLLREFDSRPAVSRGIPTKGDMAGASLQLQQAVLAWEEALCCGKYVCHDVMAHLGMRRVATASAVLRSAQERFSAYQRAAETEKLCDEEEHHKSFRKLQKLRGAEGERQRAAATKALEQRRVLRMDRLQEMQTFIQQADERSREAVAEAESARKHRDSMGGWRDHVRGAMEGLSRAAQHAEGSSYAIAQSATAVALFRNNRDMFYHDEHFKELRTDLPDRIRQCDAALDELNAVRPIPIWPPPSCSSARELMKGVFRAIHPAPPAAGGCAPWRAAPALSMSRRGRDAARAFQL
jgi:hypothetical protein